MDQSRYFSADYAEARRRFLAAAAAAGACCKSFPLGIGGPAGEALAIDSAYVGKPRAARLLVLSSGIHGVEGYFGSAVQLAWLDVLAHRAPTVETGVLLIHAINPYGFAWRRRWNENNIDLNRNFITDRGFLVDDQAYAEHRRIYQQLHSFLNPAAPPSRLETFRLKAAALILAHGFAARRKMPATTRPSILAVPRIMKLGIAKLEQAIRVGQYEDPAALFYGGSRLESSAAHVSELLTHQAADREKVVHIDFHTGWGPYGEYRLFLAEEAGSVEERWARENFDATRVKAKDTQAFPERGVLMRYMAEQLGPDRYHGLVAEFGTYSPMRVLGALRAERRAHLYCHLESAPYESAKRELMEVFCPRSPAWRTSVLSKALMIIDQALAACARWA